MASLRLVALLMIDSKNSLPHTDTNPFLTCLVCGSINTAALLSVFSLVVDDFSVKYTQKSDAEHLLTTLQKLHCSSAKWEGDCYYGLTLSWDYTNQTCDISMPGYIECALQHFTHPPPMCPQHLPHAWTKPIYGAKIQYAEPIDDLPLLDAANTKCIQEILGTLLFYARAVDNTMLTTIGTIATQQSKGTK